MLTFDHWTYNVMARAAKAQIHKIFAIANKWHQLRRLWSLFLTICMIENLQYLRERIMFAIRLLLWTTIEIFCLWWRCRSLTFNNVFWSYFIWNVSICLTMTPLKHIDTAKNIYESCCIFKRSSQFLNGTIVTQALLEIYYLMWL